MGRPLRLDFANAIHHVTSRGNERKDIFRTDRDREKFLEYLAEAVRRYGWLITAWVLMSNHFHLVIETPSPTLSAGMQNQVSGVRASLFAHHWSTPQFVELSV